MKRGMNIGRAYMMTAFALAMASSVVLPVCAIVDGFRMTVLGYALPVNYLLLSVVVFAAYYVALRFRSTRAVMDENPWILHYMIITASATTAAAIGYEAVRLCIRFSLLPMMPTPRQLAFYLAGWLVLWRLTLSIGYGIRPMTGRRRHG